MSLFEDALERVEVARRRVQQGEALTAALRMPYGTRYGIAANPDRVGWWLGDALRAIHERWSQYSEEFDTNKRLLYLDRVRDWLKEHPTPPSDITG